MSSADVLMWLRRPFHQAAGSAEAERVAALQASVAEAPAARPSSSPLRWLANLAATVISGLGLGGVVSLIGAAVLWVRFDEAGLPATQALAVVPDGQLLIQGAAATVTAVLIGLLAVLVLFSLDRTGEITNASAISLALLWTGGVGYAILGTDLAFGAVILLMALGLVLTGVAVGIGKVTGSRFVPFAIAVFGSAVVFGGAVSFGIARQQDFIQPAAVLRNVDGQGIRGFYIADTDEFIYIGVIRREFEPRGTGDPVPMYRIPRDEQTRLLIGKLQPFKRAVGQTETLRHQLKETERTDDPVPDAPADEEPPPDEPAGA